VPANIDLSIPFSRDAAPPDLEIRPRNAKRWIDSLPLNITFQSGRNLREYLAAINRTRIDVDARLEIVEACHAAASGILAELESMYASASLPLGPAPRSALGLARELWTELALGYRITVVDSGAKVFATRKQLATLLLKAVQCTTSRMYAAYKSYTPVPTGTWAELHELYLCAEELLLAREPADERKGNIVDAYVDALLLSLTDPYRLAPGEAEKVLKLLADYRGLATLGETRPRTQPGGHFVVPCNTDKPAKPSIGKHDDTGGPDWRLLDANPVVERLRARHAQLEVAQAITKAPGTRETAQSELIGKLIRLWGDPPKRTSRRDPGQTTVAISMGIDGVGHFVGLQSRVDLEREEAGLRKGITMPLAPLPVDSQSEPIPVFEWDVVNESKGGLRVRRLEPTQQPIAVGEVAGIKLPGKPYWSVGVVRWVTVFEDGGMEFGLQYLAAQARAVSVKAWGASGTGLLLVHDDRPTSLLTSPNMFSKLGTLELEDGDDSCLVDAADVLEVTHRFEVFVVTTH
jgi:hypothetical protein